MISIENAEDGQALSYHLTNDLTKPIARANNFPSGLNILLNDCKKNSIDYIILNVLHKTV